jgi:hypothetical protein
VDVPVSAHRAFVFNANGRPSPQKVLTLRQFVSELENTAAPALEPYILRGDFSRWIGDVFGDRALADDLRALEKRYRTETWAETVQEMVSAVRSRYDLAEDELDTVVR